MRRHTAAVVLVLGGCAGDRRGLPAAARGRLSPVRGRPHCGRRGVPVGRGSARGVRRRPIRHASAAQGTRAGAGGVPGPAGHERRAARDRSSGRRPAARAESDAAVGRHRAPAARLDHVGGRGAEVYAPMWAEIRARYEGQLPTVPIAELPEWVAPCSSGWCRSRARRTEAPHRRSRSRRRSGISARRWLTASCAPAGPFAPTSASPSGLRGPPARSRPVPHDSRPRVAAAHLSRVAASMRRAPPRRHHDWPRAG
jgi:hypothetical protein